MQFAFSAYTTQKKTVPPTEVTTRKNDRLTSIVRFLKSQRTQARERLGQLFRHESPRWNDDETSSSEKNHDLNDDAAPAHKKYRSLNCDVTLISGENQSHDGGASVPGDDEVMPVVLLEEKGMQPPETRVFKGKADHGENRKTLEEVLRRPGEPKKYSGPSWAGEPKYQAASRFAGIKRCASTDLVPVWERFERAIGNAETDAEYINVLQSYMGEKGAFRGLDAAYMTGGILLAEGYFELIEDSASLKTALENLKDFYEENKDGLGRCGGFDSHVKNGVLRKGVKEALNSGGFLEYKQHLMNGNRLLRAVVREFEKHPLSKTKEWKAVWNMEKKNMRVKKN